MIQNDDVYIFDSNELQHTVLLITNKVFRKYNVNPLPLCNDLSQFDELYLRYSYRAFKDCLVERIIKDTTTLADTDRMEWDFTYYFIKLLSKQLPNYHDQYVVENGQYVSLAPTMFSEISDELYVYFIDNNRYYRKLMENPYLEYELFEYNRNYIGIKCLGDYRIRRYHELVRNGTITDI